ncbi:MAG: QueT transporter family protein [Clostridia bacterium]|nr:QueT transporter family protein [Clostridia bacterium]
MQNKTIRFITMSAVIAALYVVLTWLTNFIPPIGGVFQLRIAEAMCILPMFTFAAVPGLALGCFLTNLLMGYGIYDVVFGTLATLIGAVLTYLISYRKNETSLRSFTVRAILGVIPPTIANALLIPFVILITSEVPITAASYFPLVLDVGLGELVCVAALGIPLAFALRPHAGKVFPIK